jgi:hypothetical protein
MSESRIMLTENEVPVGSKVHIYLPGSDAPEKEKGDPIVFLKLYGGVPTRAKLYQVLGDNLGGGYEQFKEEVLFSPNEVYSPQHAPLGWRYAVFSKGKRMIHKFMGFEHPYEALKDENEILVSCHFPFQESSAAGIPAFESKLEKYQKISDDELVNSYESHLKNISTLKDWGEEQFKSDISKLQHEADVILEAFSRRHREPTCVGVLVNFLEHFGKEYLTEISDDVELVRVGGIKTL